MASDTAPTTRLLEMLDGYRVVQALHAAAQIGIADLLADGPQSSEALALASGTHAPSLRRLLRALASLDVLEEQPDGRFTLTALGVQLRSDVPGSLRAAVLFYGGKQHWKAWGGLHESVRTGDTAFGPRSPTAFADMAARDPAGAATFNAAMAALTGAVNASVVAAYDFSRFATLVDVGGGYGALLAGILRATPGLRGTVFEIPAVVEGARERIAAAGLAERCEVVGGDAFTAVPAGADAYIFKWILHDWDDASSTTLLTNCRAAIGAGGTLLIVERVLPERAAPGPGATAFLADLNMLLLTGGRERTEAEFRALFAATGFRLGRIVPTGAPNSIIEAVPV
jgi:hypothetical protein